MVKQGSDFGILNEGKKIVSLHKQKHWLTILFTK
jgi:hypothetical protein